MLLTFGGATLYSVWAVHTLGQKLRLVALGYSGLRLELQDQQTLQANLQKRLAEPDASPRAAAAVAADRKLRRLRLHAAQQHLGELRRSVPTQEVPFLEHLERDLAELERLYTATDAQPREPQQAQGEVPGVEEQAFGLLLQLSSRLTNKVVDVVSAGERYESRAAWMTIALALLAAACSVVVIFLVQATLRPLRLLCDSAKEVARGNYRERVAADSPDEVGALGREFNAMAAALAEREQRLRRSEQLAAVGKLAAQITHEVRNPLTSIGLNAELLVDELTPEDGEAQTLARAIVKEVDRLTDITEQYLRFARLPAPRFERVELNELLRSLLLFLDEELRTRGVAVQVELSGELPAVAMDDNQLRQVLLNLIRNAAEAMAELPAATRQLLVRSRVLAAEASAAPPREDGSAPPPPASGVAVDIVDHGPGIPPENQRQIFEPFFTTKQGGTGLGLALAQEVISRHRGRLTVHSPLSETPPRGTRFTIELPG